MTTTLLVLGAIAPLTFAALLGLGALVGVVAGFARLDSRHAWSRQQSPPRDGGEVARFDAQNPQAGHTLIEPKPAATAHLGLGAQIDPTMKASWKTLDAERRDSEKLWGLLRRLEESQPGPRRRQTVLAVRGFSIDDINFALWHRN